VQEAYLEERYGLNDPALVQYARWLGRISPVKFGARDLVAPDGEILPRPGPIRPPTAWHLFTTSLPPQPGPGTSAIPARPASDDSTEARKAWADEAWRAFARERARFATARADAVRTRAELETALSAYAAAAGMADAESAGKLRPEAFQGHTPQTQLPAWTAARQAADAALNAFDVARRAHADLLASFDDHPVPTAGVAIIPGVMSLAAPDFGVAFSRNRPVLALIGEALPVTLLLNLIAFPIIYLVAVPGGMLAAARAGTWIDAGLGGLFVALWSIPAVWAGVLAVGFLASQQYLGFFPVSGLHDARADAMAFLPGTGIDGQWEPGYLLDLLWHICLPVACLVYAGFAVLSKQTRAAMLENLSADYVRTARAKGVSGRDVLFRHVLRNSLLPLITMFVSLFPAMLSGSVVIERIFSVPGMGSMIIEAINLRDRELLLANTLMIAAVNLFALLLADILYAAADPRVAFA
jgi:ABC-type dipeptide/oligopeptide/nickel transport system permease component